MKIFDIKAGGKGANPGNLLDYVSANGLMRRPDIFSSGRSFPAGLLTAANRPGAVLLQQKVSPAIWYRPSFKAPTLAEALTGVFPGGYFGSTEDDCLYGGALPILALDNGAHADYHLYYSAKSGSVGSVSNLKTLTRAMLLDAKERVATNANMAGSYFEGKMTHFSLRLNLGSASSRQPSMMTLGTYAEGYGEKFVVGSSTMSVGFSCKTGTTTAEDRAIIDWKWHDEGGVLLAFPGAAPGSKITAAIYAKAIHHPVANWYSQSGGSVTPLWTSGQLAVGFHANPIAGAFTNQWPSPVLLDRDFLSESSDGNYTLASLFSGTRVFKEWAQVRNRDGDYIVTEDRDGSPSAFVNLVVPPSRLMLLHVSLSPGYITSPSYAGDVTLDIRKNLQIYDGFDNLFWSKNGDRTTIHASELHQENEYTVELSVELLNTVMSPDA